MACFWQDLVGATQVCPDDPPPGPTEPEFESYNVGTSGGFFLFRSSWFGAGTNLIDQALTAEINVSMTGYMDGETLVPLDPPITGYYQATGFGADPGGSPSDFQCFLFAPEDLDAAGFPFGVATDVIVEFDPPGGAIAMGTVTAEFGQ